MQTKTGLSAERLENVLAKNLGGGLDWSMMMQRNTRRPYAFSFLVKALSQDRPTSIFQSLEFS